MRKNLSKKGISEKIATVLLVGLVVAAVAIGFIWTKQFMKSRVSKEQALSEKKFQCTDVSFTVRSLEKTGGTLLISLENKRDIKIEKFTFRIGDGEAVPIESFEVLDGMEIKNYEVNVAGTGLTEFKKVDVIPWIKVAKNVFVPCSDQHVLAELT